MRETTIFNPELLSSFWEIQGVVQQVAFHIYYATFNRWNDKRKVNVNRNDNDWNDNWWLGGVRNYFISPTLRRGFV